MSEQRYSGSDAAASGDSDSFAKGAFIHSALDDYGLTAAQFRVFCHIRRREDGRNRACEASIQKMAKVVRLNKDTVADCLKFLTANRLISKVYRSGDTCSYRVLPRDQWCLPVGNEGLGARKLTTKGSPQITGTDAGKAGLGDPQELRGYKGNPFEGNPDKALKVKAQHRRREKELLERAESLLGRSVMATDGGKFRNWIREDAGKFERVIDDLKDALRNAAQGTGPAIDSLGGYVHDTWHRFKSGSFVPELKVMPTPPNVVEESAKNSTIVSLPSESGQNGTALVANLRAAAATAEAWTPPKRARLAR